MPSFLIGSILSLHLCFFDFLSNLLGSISNIVHIFMCGKCTLCVHKRRGILECSSMISNVVLSMELCKHILLEVNTSPIELFGLLQQRSILVNPKLWSWKFHFAHMFVDHKKKINSTLSPHS